MAPNKKLVIPTGRELLKSIRNIRADWKMKSPLQKWCYLYGIGRASCTVMILPVFEGDQTLHWLAYQGIVHGGLFIILAAYTVAYHWIGGQYAKCLPCTCLLCPLIAVRLKLYFTL